MSAPEVEVYAMFIIGVPWVWPPGMEHCEELRFEWASGTAPLALKDLVLEDRPEAEEDIESTLPVKTCKASGGFGSTAEEINDELPTKVAGDVMEHEDSFKSMFGIVDDLGKEIFDDKDLLQLKRLATVYDLALELDFPDAVVTAESKVATFLSDAIDQADDEDKADAIRDIATAMVELREEEDQAVAERERLYAEAEGGDGAGDQN